MVTVYLGWHSTQNGMGALTYAGGMTYKPRRSGSADVCIWNDITQKGDGSGGVCMGRRKNTHTHTHTHTNKKNNNKKTGMCG